MGDYNTNQGFYDSGYGYDQQYNQEQYGGYSDQHQQAGYGGGWDNAGWDTQNYGGQHQQVSWFPKPGFDPTLC